MLNVQMQSIKCDESELERGVCERPATVIVEARG